MSTPADLSDRFVISIDGDAEPSDTIGAIAEFLIAVAEKRRSANTNTTTAGQTSPAAVEN